MNITKLLNTIKKLLKDEPNRWTVTEKDSREYYLLDSDGSKDLASKLIIERYVGYSKYDITIHPYSVKIPFLSAISFSKYLDGVKINKINDRLTEK